MSSLGLAELADRTRLEPGGWSVLLVEEPQIGATTRELVEELSFLIEDDGAGSVQVVEAGRSGAMLVEEIARLGPDDVALVPLPADRIKLAARSLDYERGRLVSGPRGVILTSEAGVRVLAAEAPSFWSWIGPRVWTLDPSAGRLDTEARLASLRQGTGLCDAEVLKQAEAGTLAPDPVFAEWLVLLGRGDLLGR